jgi:hypothetical protein
MLPRVEIGIVIVTSVIVRHVAALSWYIRLQALTLAPDAMP